MLTTNDILKFLKDYKKNKQDIYHIKKIGIFGSYAKNMQNENSDIDIVVEFSKPDMFNQIGIMQELKEYFKKDIDVISLWKHINPKLKKRIDQDAIYV
jgi:predicted nucleotidyltransferase